MRIQIFTIDILNATQQQGELNVFLASHKVLAVTKELVRVDERAYWTFCIEYGDSPTAPTADATEKKSKVDYKELLSPDHFELFSRLRDVRRDMAEREDVPVYNILTNAQLAEIVQHRIRTREGLIGVKGVGESRVKRYGDELLGCLQTLFEEDES